MLVRIKGKIEAVDVVSGQKKSDGSPWAKKVYTIRDTMYNKEEYNTKVCVNDFGKLDPNKSEQEFVFKSYHVVGEEVDLACYLETNDYGFTNINYGKPYAEIESPKENKSNVVRPEEQPAETDPSEEGTSDLPF